MNTDYSIWTFAFARGEMACDFFGGCPIWSNKGTVRNPMTYTIIRGGSLGEKTRTIAIDTGFLDAESMSGKGFVNIEMPEEVLSKIGLKTTDVDTIILTHMHFDHMGNIAAFPKANIFVQLEEYLGWMKVLELPDDLKTGEKPWIFSSFHPEDLIPFKKAMKEGRVHFLDGTKEIIPGVICHLAKDTHSFGSQWVEVQTATGPYVIAGDCVYWYDNIEQMWPPGYDQGNSWNIIRAYREIRENLDGDIGRVIPAHEPKLFELNRSWLSGKNDVAEVHLAAGETSKRNMD